ncbi:MAG TPA: nuclear transport factor 2 family protein [Reyranella sp.]|jgi:hypothetical protein
MAAKSSALVRRSAADIIALLHPDFLVVTAGGKAISRADYIDVAITGSLVYHGQQVREIEVRPFGTTAVATMLLDDHFTVDGQEVIETYHALFVFTFTDGRWLWAGGQAMKPRDLEKSL